MSSSLLPAIGGVNWVLAQEESLCMLEGSTNGAMLVWMADKLTVEVAAEHFGAPRSALSYAVTERHLAAEPIAGICGCSGPSVWERGW